jgi:hypothetical protein
MAMHIRPSQINPNLQLEAMYAAEKTAAKREVERTRKKLMEFASKLSGEIGSDDGDVVQVGVREESQDESQENAQWKSGGEQQDYGNDARERSEETRSAEANSSLSDWA